MAAPMRNTGRSEHFFSNVVWSWAGVAATLVSGIFLSPYLIRKLGEEAYGVWVLVFGFIEFYWLFDLGFRSATVKYVAHYRAIDEPKNVNHVINTGILYSMVMGAVLMAATLIAAQNVHRFFQVSPRYQSQFAFLVVLVGVSWSVGAAFNIFKASLEAFQSFDLSSRVSISATAVRVFGTALLLWMGFGLVHIGIVVVFSQILEHMLNYLSLRRIFPGLRVSPLLAQFSMLKKMARYGIHTFTATLGHNLLTVGPPMLIGHMRPVEFVGFFALPNRLLLYAVDAVDRVGLVTGSNAAELCAKGDFGAVSRLGAYINRYCLMLFMPLTIFLSFYAAEVVRLWVKPAWVIHSAPLFPILVAGVTIGVASQYNSSAILFGLAKHRGYAWSLLIEGALLIGLLVLVIPPYGIMGAAWVTSGLMILNRGLFTPWLLCKSLQLSWWRFMASIYVRPVAIGIPVVVTIVLLKDLALPGRSWFELGTAGLLIASAYYSLAFFFGIDREHRDALMAWASKRTWLLGRLIPAREYRSSTGT